MFRIRRAPKADGSQCAPGRTAPAGAPYDKAAREISALHIRSFGVPMIHFSLNDKEHFVGKVRGGLAFGSRDICRWFDLCWTSTEDALKKYCVEGALPVYLPEGANPELHRPLEQPKTFYDVIKEDDARLRADINMPRPAKGQTSVTAEQVQQQDEELTDEQKVDAERLFEMALAQRKMGRLPGVSYKLMVDYCREIIEKYPKSSYAAKARRMLADIPEQDRKAYNVTDEEINPPK